MTLLLFTYRRHQIIAEKNELNYKLDALRRKRMDLQAYAANIADGPVTMQKLMDVPASQFDRMSIFTAFSNQVGMAGAQENLAKMQQAGALQLMMNQVPAEQQQAYLAYIQNQMFEKARSDFADHEKKLLNAEDKKIEQQQAEMEDRLKMVEAEEKTVEEQEGKAAEASAPKFVA